MAPSPVEADDATPASTPGASPAWCAPTTRPGPGPAGPPGRPARERGPAQGGTEQARLVNELALAHRAGAPDALERLIAELRPILMSAITRYGGLRRPLPGALDLEDLIQQSWLIVDTLAHRWNPDQGDFGAYVRCGFAIEIGRYVRMLSAQRRSREVRVDQVGHDDLVDRWGDVAGSDGREWDRQLILAEMLDDLEPTARRLLLMRAVERRPMAEVARALGLSRADAARAYRHVLDRLRLQSDGDLGRGRAIGSPIGRRTMARLVEALHEGARANGTLPGREWVCARVGISAGRFGRMIELLVERGCIAGRGARRPGRLVYGTAEETLRRVTEGPAARPRPRRQMALVRSRRPASAGRPASPAG